MNSSTPTNNPITDSPKVRHETKRGAKRRPEQRIRRAERPQPGANRDAINQVHERLHQELAADAVRRVVEGLGGDGEVAMAHPNR